MQDVPHLGDVVFTFSLETWADARRRQMARPPDRLLQALLMEPSVDDLVVANAYRNYLTETIRRIGERDDPLSRKPNVHLTRPLRTRRSDPVDPARVATSYARYARHLQRSARRVGMVKPAVVSFNPFVAAYGHFEWASTVLYYARDDWASFPPRRAWWDAYEHAYAEIRTRRRKVVAVSSGLLDRISPHRGDGVVIPNGIDAEEWRPRRPAPLWFEALPAPRLLYVGSLDDRLDVDLIRRLAGAFPATSIALVGPLLQPRHFLSLKAYPNIHMHGQVDRHELVGIVQLCDVALIPHVRSPLTSMMSPLKLYEYLAGGAPVVAPDLPPMRHLGERVLLVDSHDQFVDAVEHATGMAEQSEDDRVKFIGSASWSQRHREVFRILSSVTSG